MQNLNVKSPSSQRGKATPPDKTKSKLRFDYTPSKDGIDFNLLILFHGLAGDSKAPFTNLGKKLELPQTATLSIEGPEEIPFMDGCHAWYPAIDMMTGSLLGPSSPLRMKGLLRTRVLVTELIQHLIQDCGFDASRIFLFGFSQGGTVALDQALFGDIRNLGGVVSISGYLLEEEASQKPIGNGYGGYILITQGDKDATIGNKRTAEDRFKTVQKMCSSTAITSQVFIPGKDHAMPASKQEWQTIHTFFAERMPRRNLELENMADVYIVE
ncbi:Alpha/Beta hydrolase protein [Syncephalastrum racemosum]|uniref:Alpha/Beta hydrolase protein n=1 Tax=Syncephalastrum racemosum TaxID=13706 RepID=A0A1X2H402_SYNRA|nr:Alpha/Beta hydrolase protein [Syncephalastrum racemosum]